MKSGAIARRTTKRSKKYFGYVVSSFRTTQLIGRLCVGSDEGERVSCFPANVRCGQRRTGQILNSVEDTQLLYHHLASRPVHYDIFKYMHQSNFNKFYLCHKTDNQFRTLSVSQLDQDQIGID